jgi:hypothetical protein
MGCNIHLRLEGLEKNKFSPQSGGEKKRLNSHIKQGDEKRLNSPSGRKQDRSYPFIKERFVLLKFQQDIMVNYSIFLFNFLVNHERFVFPSPLGGSGLG